MFDSGTSYQQCQISLIQRGMKKFKTGLPSLWRTVYLWFALTPVVHLLTSVKKTKPDYLLYIRQGRREEEKRIVEEMSTTFHVGSLPNRPSIFGLLVLWICHSVSPSAFSSRFSGTFGWKPSKCWALSLSSFFSCPSSPLNFNHPLLRKSIKHCHCSDRVLHLSDLKQQHSTFWLQLLILRALKFYYSLYIYSIIFSRFMISWFLLFLSLHMSFLMYP